MLFISIFKLNYNNITSLSFFNFKFNFYSSYFVILNIVKLEINKTKNIFKEIDRFLSSNRIFNDIKRFTNVKILIKLKEIKVKILIDDRVLFVKKRTSKTSEFVNKVIIISLKIKMSEKFL